MLIFRLAFRNIYGAGLRTWLNVIALSFSFVAIIYMQGLYNGMSDQMERITQEAEYAGGQYWHNSYDPFDPLTLEDAHGRLPENLQNLIDRGEAMPILIRSATIYPGGRFQNAMLKGISPDQKILSIPSNVLENSDSVIPALIGGRMAKNTGLKKGDYVTVRWRDTNGTFDADEIFITEVMKTDASGIDSGQLWIPIEKMREMMDMRDEATIVVLESGSQFAEKAEGWNHKDLDFLMQDVRALFLTKSIGGSVFYIILLLLAMLALFDTQILSIFRRRKEMGTLMALGMTRGQLIRLFTLEGSIHAVLAAVVAAIYGIPLLIYSAKTGFGLPEATDDFGLSMGNRIFPTFTAALIAGTVLLVLIVTTIVSYLPTRRIAKLEPTDALRGKMT
ncbi:MAG: FtsX-like permease family protein [Spirochaetia bacterium]|jgi:ABC-type lipoprotein release transport system permease subunit|nr:FtsX-like permease family protein [Spirochaetia bacterium]